MRNRSFSFPAVLTGLASILLIASCTLFEQDEDDKGGPGSGAGRFSTQHEMELVSHTPPQDGQPGLLVTREVDTWCEDGAPVTETMLDSSLYVIQDGELYVWGKGDCQVGERLSGNSSTIFGTWTGAYIEGTGGPVPAPHRPEACGTEPDGDDEEEFSAATLFEDYQSRIVVSEEKITVSMSATLCYARTMATMFAMMTSDIDTVSFGCTETVLRNGAGETATFTSSYSGDTMSLTFVHGESTCELADPFGFLPDEGTEVCSEGGENGAGDDGMSCLMGSGFFGDMSMLEKASATSALSSLKARSLLF